MPKDKDSKCQIFEEQEPFTQSSELYSKIRDSCLSILNKSALLLADTEQNTVITFHNSETISLFEERFNEIVDAMEQLSNEFKYEQNEHMVIGSAIVELLQQINCNRVKCVPKEKANDLVESETIDSELENIIHCILIPMQSIYKKCSKQKKEDLLSSSVQSETSSDAKTEKDLKENEDLIEENHLKTKINYELLSELEILSIEKVTRKLNNILLTIQYGKCNDIPNVTQKIIRLLPILEQYNLFCKFYLIQQIGAHKVSTKMMSVMLTVFVELGSKVFYKK